MHFVISLQFFYTTEDFYLYSHKGVYCWQGTRLQCEVDSIRWCFFTPSSHFLSQFSPLCGSSCGPPGHELLSLLSSFLMATAAQCVCMCVCMCLLVRSPTWKQRKRLRRSWKPKQFCLSDAILLEIIYSTLKQSSAQNSVLWVCICILVKI